MRAELHRPLLVVVISRALILAVHDGDQLELSTDMAAMKQTIERYEGKDGWERFLSFLAEARPSDVRSC